MKNFGLSIGEVSTKLFCRSAALPELSTSSIVVVVVVAARSRLKGLLIAVDDNDHDAVDVNDQRPGALHSGRDWRPTISRPTSWQLLLSLSLAYK